MRIVVGRIQDWFETYLKLNSLCKHFARNILPAVLDAVLFIIHCNNKEPSPLLTDCPVCSHAVLYAARVWGGTYADCMDCAEG